MKPKSGVFWVVFDGGNDGVDDGFICGHKFATTGFKESEWVYLQFETDVIKDCFTYRSWFYAAAGGFLDEFR